MCRKLVKCVECGRIGYNDEFIAVPLSNRGGRNAYLCPEHATRRGDRGYTLENDVRRGDAGHGFTFSCEMEMHGADEIMRAELESVDFIPTYDCTTDTEFKSPIWQSLNPLPKKFATIEKLINAGHGRITNADGTHFHVGHKNYINATTIRYLQRFYHSLFIPLNNAMVNNPEATEKLFGRYFTGYACTINERTIPEAHSNFINLQHSYTIEFRLCKFKTADQYMNCVKFCKDATATIINNFIIHFNDTNIDSRRYKNITEYRKHKADVTAKKLVKLFEKYSA